MIKRLPKSHSAGKIADIFLAELAKEQEPAPFLNDFLKRKNIYFDKKLIMDSLAMPRNEGLIQEVNRRQLSGVTYSRSNDTSERLKSVEVFLARYSITDKGIYFVKGGQLIDAETKAEQIERRKKNRERLINAAISFCTAVLTLVIKWFFFDKK